MDGVQLDRLTPGRVCYVSPSLGSWLLAQGYAELEMRTSSAPTEEGGSTATSEERASSFVKALPRHVAGDRRRRNR